MSPTSPNVFCLSLCPSPMSNTHRQNQYQTVQDSTKQYKTVQDSTRHYKTLQDITTQYKTVQGSHICFPECSRMQLSEQLTRILQCLFKLDFFSMLSLYRSLCNILQHIANIFAKKNTFDSFSLPYPLLANIFAKKTPLLRVYLSLPYHVPYPSLVQT